jgi:hypothetical protein
MNQKRRGVSSPIVARVDLDSFFPGRLRVERSNLFRERQGRARRRTLTQPERRTASEFDSALNALYIIANYF